MEFEDLVIEFGCPECHAPFPVGLHQLIDGGVMICPSCRATNVELELENLERHLRSIGSSLQNLKKCLEHGTRP